MNDWSSLFTMARLTEEQVLEAVDALRTKEGSCTYDGLAHHLGLSKTGIYYRVQKLAEKGRLEVTEGAVGSIRRPTSASGGGVEVGLVVTLDPVTLQAVGVRLAH